LKAETLMQELLQDHTSDDRSGTLFAMTAFLLKEHRNDISSQDKHVTIYQFSRIVPLPISFRKLCRVGEVTLGLTLKLRIGGTFSSVKFVLVQHRGM
jgi:hypothetical protein